MIRLRLLEARITVPIDCRNEPVSQRCEAIDREISSYSFVAATPVGDSAAAGPGRDDLPLGAGDAQNGAGKLLDRHVLATSEIINTITASPIEAATDHLADIADVDEIPACPRIA